MIPSLINQIGDCQARIKRAREGYELWQERAKDESLPLIEREIAVARMSRETAIVNENADELAALVSEYEFYED